MANEKKEKAEEVKEAVKETTKKAEEKVEDVKEAVKEKVEDVKNTEENKNIFTIIAVVLIVVIIAIAMFLICKKPNPKSVAKDILYLKKVDPLQILTKYGMTERDKQIQKINAKYTDTKITEIGEIKRNEETNEESVVIKYKVKMPKFSEIEQQAKDAVSKEKGIKENHKDFQKEFLKKYKQLLNEKKDQKEEVEKTLKLNRPAGEKNWVIDPSSMFD